MKTANIMIIKLIFKIKNKKIVEHEYRILNAKLMLNLADKIVETSMKELDNEQ